MSTGQLGAKSLHTQMLLPIPSGYIHPSLNSLDVRKRGPKPVLALWLWWKSRAVRTGWGPGEAGTGRKQSGAWNNSADTNVSGDRAGKAHGVTVRRQIKMKHQVDLSLRLSCNCKWSPTSSTQTQHRAQGKCSSTLHSACKR